MTAYSLYLHIPFCKHRCGYCDFNTYAGVDHLRGEYVKALAGEIKYTAESAEEKLPVQTVYLGGGTPSLLSASEIERIMSAIDDDFLLSSDAEITLEANPGTVDYEYFLALKSMGVNRLSLGVQSANPMDLRILEREHGYQEAIEAIKEARLAGMDNISVDLIYGLPGQSLGVWESNLDLALQLKPEHISLYSLTVEHGTPLEKLVNRGLLDLPDSDLAADMYELTMEKLKPNGFVHYEISNWARNDPGGRLLLSRHNQQYWYNQPYLGLGAGAHGFAEKVRTRNVLAPAAYIKRISSGKNKPFPETPATVNVRTVDAMMEMQETMMMGLRLLVSGVSRERFQTRFNKKMDVVFKDEIEELIRWNLLEWAGRGKDTLRLTKRGGLLGNQVFQKFV